jgi:hypothetical protein
MNSVCAYLKFDPELSICSAKNKHRFHIKEVNFILYFSLKNNTILDDIVTRMRRLYKTGIGLRTRFIGSHTVTVYTIYNSLLQLRPPLWSSGQSFWLQIQRSRVRFPSLPDFLRGSGSGTGSTQPREYS